jgi:glycerate kinase
MAFLRAEMQPGFDLFARQTSLERRLRAADLVLTGEGALDRSTVMGKGVGQVAECCRRLSVPCIGLAGMVSAGRGMSKLFAQAHGLTELTSIQQATAQPALWLERLAQRVARSMNER